MTKTFIVSTNTVRVQVKASIPEYVTNVLIGEQLSQANANVERFTIGAMCVGDIGQATKHWSVMKGSSSNGSI